MASNTRHQKFLAVLKLTFLVAPAIIGIWLFYAVDTLGGGPAATSRAEARPLEGPLISSFPGPTQTATVSPPLLLSGLPIFVPVEATMQPVAGSTTAVEIKDSQGHDVGKVNVPGDAAGGVPLKVVVRPAPTPTIPPSLSLLGSLEISFTNLNDSSSVRDLNQEVTIEMSYAGRGLSDAELNRLVIYNATRQEFLPTTLDRSRQVAIARTKRFSSFWLWAGARTFAPLLLREFETGW